MKYISSAAFMLIYFPCFALAFIPAIVISAIVDAYRVAANANRWLP